MRASDLFVRQLEEEGVEYIFALPGEENLQLLESIRKSKIKVIITRHEQAAAFMAATYGRLKGRAGICLSTLGPGATNLMTGIAHAQLIGAPLISISGQKAIGKNWQARFQLIDVVGLMKPITKKSVTILDPDNIPTILRDAFKTAEAERPGAVHIELPEDVASEKTDASVQKRAWSRRPSPDMKATIGAAELIRKAKYPLIILSSGANRHRISEALSSFIGATGIYAVHTQMGKGVLSDADSHSLFATGIHAFDYVNCAIEKSDLIITIGYNIVEYPPYVWNKDLSKKIVNIDFVQSEPDRYFNPDIEVIADISATLQALGPMLKRRSFPYFSETRKRLESKIADPPVKKFPFHPKEIVDHVRKALSDDDIITLDNGIFKLWFSRLYKTYRPNTFILDNALATMGAGLPSGIAAKMLNPGKNVLAICGDGGFMMNSQELETAVRNKIPIVVLIIRDDAYGFIRWKQEAMGLPDYGMGFGNPDFVKLAEAYGIPGIRIKKGDDLYSKIKLAFSYKKPVIIECPVDYSYNYSTFSKELKNIKCDI